MGLSEFIQANQEAILAEFDAYARAHIPPGESMSAAELRDHASQVLTAISAEMRQQLRSPAATPNPESAPSTPAEKHGSSRQAKGFDISHVLAEYRVLRATVMRLWLGSRPPLGAAGVEDLVRFNEAIDRAVAESVAQFEAEARRGGAGPRSSS